MKIKSKLKIQPLKTDVYVWCSAKNGIPEEQGGVLAFSYCSLEAIFSPMVTCVFVRKFDAGNLLGDGVLSRRSFVYGVKIHRPISL